MSYNSRVIDDNSETYLFHINQKYLIRTLRSHFSNFVKITVQ